jgi:hypothetical protein
MMGKSLRVLMGKDEPPAPVEKVKFTAAGVDRLLAFGESIYPHKNWSSNKLYASGIGYTTVAEFVLQYFDHTAIVKSFGPEVCMAMEAGTALHEYIQSRLMLAGVLHPKIDGTQYVEQRFECPEYRIVAKVDGLIDEMQLAELGKKGLEIKHEPRPLKLDLFEIKVFNGYNYEKTKTWQDISYQYRMQATATQKISGYPRTIFMFVNIDTKKYRFVVYRAEETLWDKIKAMSTEIFTHLRNLTRPEGFKDEWLQVNGQKLTWEQWTQFHIQQHPKRKWLHLEGNPAEEERQTGGFFIA